MYVSVEGCEGKKDELRGLVQHSIILAMPRRASAVELRRNSLSVINPARLRRPTRQHRHSFVSCSGLPAGGFGELD